MSVAALQDEVVYEDSDGRRISDNTLQFRWIMTLQGGLDALFRADPNVFVAGDLLWYPVKGQPKVRAAPDAMVALGRPKGYRGSYKQWVEGGIAPQVVFEVLSPNNHAPEMRLKHAFYERHGVEEYYVYDPDHVTLAGYLRDRAGQLGEVPVVDGHVSPLLGIRFELAEELMVYRPDGERFLTYVELVERAEENQLEVARERQATERERQATERERQATERERQATERERQATERERQAAAQATAALESLRAKLRAAGIDPDAV